jgi:hypothetical protein
MAYSEKKRAYNVEYIQKNIKRVPLDVQNDKYKAIKAAADAAGESVNGYIKRAIDERMKRDAATASGAVAPGADPSSDPASTPPAGDADGKIW